jgi:drug/metabolite transporter (DMT)-like permease
MCIAVTPYFVLLLVSILWGGNFISCKIALSELHPNIFIFLRILLTSFIFILSYCFVGIPKYIKQNFWKIFVLSLLGIIANQYFFIYGLNYTHPSHSALIICFIPIFAHIVAYLGKVEKFEFKTIISLIVAILGFVIMHLEKNMLTGIFLGDVLNMIGALFFGIYMVLFKAYSINMSIFDVTSLTFIFAVPISFVITIPHLNQLPHLVGVLTFKGTGALLYTVIFASIVAYNMHLWVIRKMKVSKVSLFTFLQPIWATLFSLFFFEPTLSIYFIVGGILIIFSLFISEL